MDKRIATGAVIVVVSLLLAFCIGAYGGYRQTRPRWLKCNFHAHSTLSHGTLPPEAVKEAYRLLGYDVLALTDNNIVCAEERCGDMLIIPGVELGMEGHHLIVLGTPPDEVRIFAHAHLPWGRLDENGVYDPQPIPKEFFRRMMLEYDAYECMPGAAYDFVKRDKPFSWKDRYGKYTVKPGVSSDDSHQPQDIGRRVTWVYAPPRTPDILAALRTRRRVRVEITGPASD